MVSGAWVFVSGVYGFFVLFLFWLVGLFPQEVNTAVSGRQAVWFTAFKTTLRPFVSLPSLPSASQKATELVLNN